MFLFGSFEKFSLNTNSRRNWSKYTPRLIYGSVIKILAEIRVLSNSFQVSNSSVRSNQRNQRYPSRKRKKTSKRSNSFTTQVQGNKKSSHYAWSRAEFDKYVYLAVKQMRKSDGDESYVLVPTTTISERKRHIGQFTCFSCEEECHNRNRSNIWSIEAPEPILATASSNVAIDNNKMMSKDNFLFQFLGTCHGNKYYPGVLFKILLGRYLTMKSQHSLLLESNYEKIFNEENLKYLTEADDGKFSFADFQYNISTTGKNWLKDMKKYVKKKGVGSRYMECCNNLQFVPDSSHRIEDLNFHDKPNLLRAMLKKFTYTHWLFLKLCRARYIQRRKELLAENKECSVSGDDCNKILNDTKLFFANNSHNKNDIFDHVSKEFKHHIVRYDDQE